MEKHIAPSLRPRGGGVSTPGVSRRVWWRASTPRWGRRRMVSRAAPTPLLPAAAGSHSPCGATASFDLTLGTTPRVSTCCALPPFATLWARDTARSLRGGSKIPCTSQAAACCCSRIGTAAWWWWGSGAGTTPCFATPSQKKTTKTRCPVVVDEFFFLGDFFLPFFLFFFFSFLFCCCC